MFLDQAQPLFELFQWLTRSSLSLRFFCNVNIKFETKVGLCEAGGLVAVFGLLLLPCRITQLNLRRQ